MEAHKTIDDSAGGVTPSGSASPDVSESFAFRLGYNEAREAIDWDLFTTPERLWIDTHSKYQLEPIEKAPFMLGVKAAMRQVKP